MTPELDQLEDRKYSLMPMTRDIGSRVQANA